MTAANWREFVTLMALAGFLIWVDWWWTVVLGFFLATVTVLCLVAELRLNYWRRRALAAREARERRIRAFSSNRARHARFN